MLVAYGIEVLPENDPNVAIVERAMATFSKGALPENYLVVRRMYHLVRETSLIKPRILFLL
jgi:hypothetical protein